MGKTYRWQVNPDLVMKITFGMESTGTKRAKSHRTVSVVTS